MKRIIYYIIIITISLYSACAHAAYTLSVSVRNRADDTSAGSVTFPGVEGLVLGGNLWIVSSQYLHIVYGSHERNWSIRVITKNNTAFGGVAPKIIGINDPDHVHGSGDDSWEAGPDGVFGTPDDVWGLGTDGIAGTGDDTLIVTFGGLINTATRNNPNSRAPIVWQVFRYNDPYNPPPPGMTTNPPTVLNDGTAGGEPISDWAYMGDTGDTGYVADPTHEYFWVAYGSGGFSLLSQHPVVYRDARGNARPKPGGGDCVVYLGARFGLKAADGVTDVAVLPAGNYSSVIYLELIHW